MTESPTLNGAFAIVPYSNPREAIGWLEQTFGAVATFVHPPEPDQPLMHAEVEIGTGLFKPNMSTLVEENATDLAKYGLDKPTMTVTVGSGSSKATLVDSRVGRKGVETRRVSLSSV